MVASAGSLNEKPRFRQDLVAEPIEDGATRFIDVADPDTGNLFRFYEVEYSLACAMDGDRDVNGIVQWAKEELGLATSPKEVQHVIATLRDLGYLERGAAAAAAAAPSQPATEAPRAAAPPAGVKPAGKPAVNKWDAPTQMGDADDYLEPGVIAAKPVPSKLPPSEELELGNAGTTPAKVETDLPRAPELELGAPGSTGAAPRAAATAKTADVALGNAGRGDVSADLSDHMAVSADDVKEAVRASQVMKAVEVPKELLESVEPTVTTAPEAKKPEAKADAKPAAKAEAKADKKAEAKPEAKTDKKAEAKPEAKADKKAEAKPEAKAEKKAEAKADKKAEAKPEAKVEKRPAAAAKEPPKEEKRPVAPPAPKSGASPVLIALLVIAVLGAAGFFAYKYVFQKKDTGAQTSATPPAPPVQPEPPPAPPVETEKLATEQPDPVDLKAPGAGQLESVIATGTTVKAGDPVAMLAGHKPLEAQIAAMQKDIDNRVKPELDKATKARDAAQAAGNKAALNAAEARIADRQKSLATKQAAVDGKQAALDKLQVKAPADGTVTAVAKANTKIAANDVIATLTKAPVLTATFKTASGVEPQSHVLLAVTGGEQKLSCTVVTADASGVKVECPQDAASAGTEVTFVGPDPSAAAAQGSDGDIEMGDEGSAQTAPEAGSAAEAPTTPDTAPAEAPKAPTPKAPAKAATKAPAHAASKATPKAAEKTAAPADKVAEPPADKAAEPPADKTADKPADQAAPAPAGSDTLK